MPVDSSEALRARASSSAIGTVALYSGASYSGSQYVLSVVQGATEFCEEWTNTNANGFPPLPEVKSYIAANIVCFTFAQSGCGGNATYILDVSTQMRRLIEWRVLSI